MNSPIRAMVDAVVRCTICGKRPGCTCWVRLECACGAKTHVERIPGDGTREVIATKCPACAEKESGSTHPEKKDPHS